MREASKNSTKEKTAVVQLLFSLKQPLSEPTRRGPLRLPPNPLSTGIWGESSPIPHHSCIPKADFLRIFSLLKTSYF